MPLICYPKPMAFRHALLIAAIISMALSALAHGGEPREVLRGEGVSVHFDAPKREMAEWVLGEYPAIMDELGSSLGLRIPPGREVRILLVSDEEFRLAAGDAPFVAFADARQRAVVVNVPKSLQTPFELRDIMKHELAHIVLGSNINPENLPRWLNEGVSQWASGGASEFLTAGTSTSLSRAVLFGRPIPLSALADGFPRQEKLIRLAYEESLSFVEYIVRARGEDSLRLLIRNLSAGEGPDAALARALSSDMAALESAWLQSLRLRHTWLTYLSNNIYSVLFVLAALVTLYGFIRVVIKIKTYRDEDDELPPGG